MRIATVFLTLLAGLACFPGCASAQQNQVGPGQLPRAGQLIAVPVGGTHIPVQSPVQQVASPYKDGDAAAISQGRALFHSMNCVGCHAPEGGGGIGPPLSDHVWIYGGEPAQIFMTIMQGRPNGMPSFANALPEDSIWKLAAYVRSLSRFPGEPGNEPPVARQSGKP
ncbi:MAG: c-type cytochrome [Novosphingobium sp.]